MNDVNPEIDLMIIDSLDFEYKSAADIASELQLSEEIVTQVLDDLIINQEIAIDRKGMLYRMPSMDDDDLEFDDE
jgi:hypothetical protein